MARNVRTTLALALPVALAATALSYTTTEATADTPAFLVGTGQYDITGAVAETGTFGFVANQDVDGLHQRLYSHAYVIADPNTGKRIVYVSADTATIFPAQKAAVIQALTAKYGNKYTDANVMLTGTHTHVGNSGMSQDMLYQIAGNDASAYGWDKRNFQAVVNGIVRSIEQADSRVAPANLSLANGDLLGATRNRSLDGYVKNKDTANYGRDVDTRMTQLNITDASGQGRGLINWFATHPTQFSVLFKRISGDTKGYAQYFFEKKMGSTPANPSFVAGFANSNTGDVVSSQGNAKSAPGFGGSSDEYLNAEIDGRRQFDKSVELWNAGGTRQSGVVDYRQRWIDFGNYTVSDKFTGAGDQKLCTPGRGWSFAAGGENNQPEIPGIKEGMTTDNTTLSDGTAAGTLVRLGFTVASGLLGGGQDPCQGKKPVLLPTGRLGWAPTKVPVQLMRVGSLAIVGFPGEITTMAGRRLTAAVKDSLAGTGVTQVLIASQANAYNAYTTTPEEYSTQQYEGASTEFGPLELAAWTQEFTGLGTAMKTGASVASTTTAPELKSLDYKPSRPGVVFDDKPLSEQWGQVLAQPKASYAAGQTASATFRGAHPKNDFRTMDTFVKVQRQVNGQWVDYLDDHDWDTTYTWKRDGVSYSKTTVDWRIRTGTPAGTYRLQQLGDWKSGWTGKVSPYVGTSAPFTVN